MGGLIERAAELSAVGELLAHVVGGSGRTLLISGPAGIGRSALAAHAEPAARAAGFTVLASRPTPVSPALEHALVRDWLGPLVRAGQRYASPPFDGPAAALATALAGPSTTQRDWSLATLDHALTWALQGLASSRPLLLVVDDVQWLDVASLQLLDLLSARLGSMAAGLLLTLRRGEPGRSSDIVDRIATRATVLEPAPFTVAGVDRLRREAGMTAGVAAVPAEELHRLTGGIPFLVHGSLRGGPGEGVPREVVEWLRERLVRLGPTADRVARTVAVLGADAHLDAVADLVGLSVAELADPLERLTDADVLTVEMWRARPAYPLLTDAILSGLAASERSDLHRDAATYLGDTGAGALSVAEHLVHTLPGEDPAVVELLRRAGEEALESGMPDVAARLLVRAVAETRPDDTAWEVLARAAMAQLLWGKPTEAFALWDRAVERAPGASSRAALLTRVGDARAALGRWPDSAEAYRQAASALADAPAGDTSGLSARRALVRAWCDGVGAGEGLEQTSEDDTHTNRLQSALAAFELAVRGSGRVRARELARRALAGDALLTEEACGGPGFYTAAAVLSWADAHAESLRALNAAVKDAHQRGSVPGIATASCWRGLVHFRQGRLRQATGDFLPALSLRAEGWSEFGESAVVGAALTHVALGQHDAALALEPALRASAAHGHFLGALPLAAAGLVRASHGDHEQAVRDFRRAARLMGAHPDNGSIVEWREFSVWSLKALGRCDEALATAEEAVHHARRWGAPRALGFALRALAQVTPRDQAIELLREAIGWFDEGGSVDYHARACTDLGRLLLTGGAEERTEGVALLRQALAYGRVRHVPSAVLRATRLLVRAGEEVSDPTADPAASLTPGERRVVDLAAAGHTNREIAQRLSVTVKAVEWHLSHAYRKLDVSSRSELTAALYGDSGPSSSSAM